MPNVEDREGPLFAINEKVLCKYGQLVYEAKILEVKSNADDSRTYLVHYTGWNKRRNEWVPEASLQKHNENSPQRLRALRKGTGIKPIDTVAPPTAQDELREELRGIKLEYSPKDIPIPGEIEYLKKLTNAIEKFIRRIGWAVHFIKNPDDEEDQRETYGFKSGSAPPREDLQGVQKFVYILTPHFSRTRVNRS